MKKNALYFCNGKTVSQNGNTILIANKNTGKWIKLTNENYDMIQQAVNEGIGKEEFCSLFCQTKDKEYMQDLLSRLEKLGILYEATEEKREYIDHFISISLSITKRCNLSCRHCSENAMFSPIESMPIETIIININKILRCNPKLLLITGGEPLIRDDFNEIVSYIKSCYNGDLSLMTNGTLINQGNAALIATSFDSISISLDGFDEYSCSLIRGKGVFDKVIENVRLLKNNGNNNISLSMVLTSYNQEHKEEFKKLNDCLGTRPIFRIFAPDGRGYKYMDELGMPEFHKNIDQTMNGKLCKESSTTLKVHVPICNALISSFIIGNDQFIYPCGATQYEELRICHISEIDNLKDYMINESYRDTLGYQNFMQLKVENFEYCKDCNVNLFCKGCPAYNLIYQKGGLLDRYCRANKKFFNETIWG